MKLNQLLKICIVELVQAIIVFGLGRRGKMDLGRFYQWGGVDGLRSRLGLVGVGLVRGFFGVWRGYEEGIEGFWEGERSEGASGGRERVEVVFGNGDGMSGGI